MEAMLYTAVASTKASTEANTEANTEVLVHGFARDLPVGGARSEPCSRIRYGTVREIWSHLRSASRANKKVNK